MSDPTGGLYPFLGGGRKDDAALLAEVRESTVRKAAEISELRRSVWRESGQALHHAARLAARAFVAGGKLLAFGNGGSATDAQDLASDLTDPPLPGWRSLPALALVQDRGVLTAVGNDVGFGDVFARQIIAYGEPGDVAVGLSTSGESENVLVALREAKDRGLGTVAFVGCDGGRAAKDPAIDALILSPSTHIPRIQEAHATAYHAMLRLVQRFLTDEEAG